MAYVYVTNRKDAEKIQDAILREHGGIIADIFRDGKGYRVQHNDLGNDKMREILVKHNLQKFLS